MFFSSFVFRFAISVKFCVFWYLYWSIWRKKGFLFYFITKILPIWPPLVNGLLVPPSPQNLPNHLGTRSEVYYTRRDAVPRCKIHRRVTIPRCMIHHVVAVPQWMTHRWADFLSNISANIRKKSKSYQCTFCGTRRSNLMKKPTLKNLVTRSL